MQRLGHSVDLSTATAEQLSQLCRVSPPDLAIVAASFAGTEKFSTVNRVANWKTCPLIAVIERSDMKHCQRMINDNVLGILISTSTLEAWRPALYLAKLRFEQSQQMEAELERLQMAVDRLEPNY